MLRLAEIVAQSLNDREHDILRNFRLYRKEFSAQEIESLAQLRLIDIAGEDVTLSKLGTEVAFRLKSQR